MAIVQRAAGDVSICAGNRISSPAPLSIGSNSQPPDGGLRSESHRLARRSLSRVAHPHFRQGWTLAGRMEPMETAGSRVKMKGRR